MKRFFVRPFCGRRRAAGCLRRTEYILCRSQATATPTSSTSRTQKSDSTVKVNETAAKVEVVTAQAARRPRHRGSCPCRDPGHGRFPRYVSGRCRRADFDLLCRSFLMLRKI